MSAAPSFAAPSRAWPTSRWCCYGRTVIAQYESGGRSHCSFDEHNEILDAIEKGDKERAVTLMMHHMEHIDSKLNLESDNASGDLHAVFSHLLGGKKKPRRAKADSDSAA